MLFKGSMINVNIKKYSVVLAERLLSACNADSKVSKINSSKKTDITHQEFVLESQPIVKRLHIDILRFH